MLFPSYLPIYLPLITLIASSVRNVCCAVRFIAFKNQTAHYALCIQVDVTILDVNDNVATFEMKEVSIWVPENAEVGSTIYEAHARDADDNENGQVTYSLLDSPGRIFSLERRNGRLILQQPLDYESVKRYSVVIGTRDEGSPSREGQNLTVFIEVQDINDCSPK